MATGSIGGSTPKYDLAESWDIRLASVERELRHAMWEESADLAADPDLDAAIDSINAARCYLTRRANPQWFWSFCSEQSESAELATDEGYGEPTPGEPCCDAVPFCMPPIYFAFEVLEDAS